MVKNYVFPLTQLGKDFTSILIHLFFSAHLFALMMMEQ